MASERQQSPDPIPAGRRGAASGVMRAHNERLLLGMLHGAGAMSAADLARMSGLSAQGVSVILRALSDQNLILRGAPQRGRVGQPTVPISINPEGAFVLGAKIGRRSADLVLLDLDGHVRCHDSFLYEWPDPVAIVQWLHNRIQDFRATVVDLAGLGIAVPSRLWDWPHGPAESWISMEAWRDMDLAAAFVDLAIPVVVVNDGSAACAAEMTFGTLPHSDEVLYFFIGTFIGGGLASRGRLVLGPTANAGSFGSILVQDTEGRVRQLIEVASLIGLERLLHAQQDGLGHIEKRPEFWTLANPAIDQWITQAARGIAQAIISAVGVNDSRLVVLDGAMPVETLDALVTRIESFMLHFPLAGIDPPIIQRGTIGPLARAIGAASVVLNERFFGWPADLPDAATVGGGQMPAPQSASRPGAGVRQH